MMMNYHFKRGDIMNKKAKNNYSQSNQNKVNAKCKTCENYNKNNNKCLKYDNKCLTEFSTCDEYLIKQKLIMF